MKLKSEIIAKITGGILVGSPDIIVNEIFTDSRQLSYTDEIAFIAISGKNHDGHSFIPDLYLKGVRAFLVEKLPEDITRFSDSAFIISENSSP